MFIISDRMSKVEQTGLSSRELEKTSQTGDVQKVIQISTGVLAALLWVVLMVVSTASVQLLERRIPDFELNAARCALPILLLTIEALARRQFPVIPREEIGSATLYSILNILSSLTIFVSVTLLPVSSVQSLAQTSSIVSGVILFYLFLDDKPTLPVLISALMCTCGVLCVIQPNFVFTHLTNENSFSVSINGNFTKFSFDSSSNLTNNTTNDSPLDHYSQALPEILKYILPVASGFIMTVDVIVVKKRTYLYDNMAEVLFWCFFTGTVLSLLITFIWEDPVLVPGTWLDTLFVSLHCFGYIGIYPLYLYSVKHISGNTFVLIASTMVIFLLVAQYTVLSSILPGNRNWIEVLGVIFVLGGSTLVSIIELCK